MKIGCNAISCNRKQYEMRMITQCVKDRHKLNTTVNRKEETEKKKIKTDRKRTHIILFNRWNNQHRIKSNSIEIEVWGNVSAFVDARQWMPCQVSQNPNEMNLHFITRHKMCFSSFCCYYLFFFSFRFVVYLFVFLIFAWVVKNLCKKKTKIVSEKVDNFGLIALRKQNCTVKRI